MCVHSMPPHNYRTLSLESRSKRRENRLRFPLSATLVNAHYVIYGGNHQNIIVFTLLYLFVYLFFIETPATTDNSKHGGVILIRKYII